MRTLSNWLQAYVEYTRNLEAPDKFHLWTGISTLAGALRGKAWIEMDLWRWKPNFFIVFVAPPGIIGKSTTANVGMSLLREVKGVHFGPDSATWQGITSAFNEAAEDYPLQDGTVCTMASITIAASEIGTFLDMNNREMIDVLVDLWDGRQVPWKRRTQGEGEKEIRNPWFNFIGCTTPAWISQHYPEYAISGGFTSRTIFVFGDHKRHLSAYPSRRPGAKEVHALREPLIEDLQEISKLGGEFKLEEAAYIWGEAWYEKHWMNLPESLKDERMGGYVARKQTHLHKLAMILSAAKRWDMTICVEDMQEAELLLNSTEQDIPRIFSKISDSQEAKYSATLLNRLQKVKKITKQDLWRYAFNLMSNQDFENALNAVINAGYAKPISYGDRLVIEYLSQDTPEPSHDTEAYTSSAESSPAPVQLPASVVAPKTA